MHTYKHEERWLSGRKRTTRNRLIGNYSWVRIPPSPFIYTNKVSSDIVKKSNMTAMNE